MNLNSARESMVRNDAVDFFGTLERAMSAEDEELAQYDENVQQAIRLARDKDQYSDFYRKLQKLNDRIQVYKAIFLQKEPKFLIKSPMASSHEPNSLKETRFLPNIRDRAPGGLLSHQSPKTL